MSDSSKQLAKGTSSSAKPLEAIVKLGKQAVASPFNPNPVLPLLNLSRNSSPEVVHKAVWALHRVFVKYINEGRVGGISSVTPRRDAGAEEEVNLEGGSVKGWVRDRLVEYIEVLTSLLRDSEPALRSSALPLLFALLPPLSASVSLDGPIIHTPYFRGILRALLSPSPSLRGATLAESSSSTSSPTWEIDEDAQFDEEEELLPADVLEIAHEEYWAKNDDIRWVFFKEAAYLLQNEPGLVAQPENLLGQLLPLTNLPRKQEDINVFFIPSLSSPPSSTIAPVTKKAKGGRKKKAKAEVDALPDWMATYESESEEEEDPSNVGRKRQRTTQMSVHSSIHSVQSHTAAYTSLWEAVLSLLPLDDVQTRRVLVGLHGEKGILGHMRADRRVRVADWLGSLVDAGGAKAMLAMNGLFILLTKYNLEYPDFYKRLYGLLDADVLHVRYRARFIRLLDTFLASSLLPAALIASFIKRLSRLALTAPPAGILIIIPFIYNLFKRHPGCMVMIQRHAEADGDEEKETDPYDFIETSPMATRAIESSCWEIASLQTHYLAAVSTMAKVFNEVFTRPQYNMEDFLDHGYDTLFATEANRRIKNAPALSLPVENGSTLDIFPTGFKREQAELAAELDDVSRLWAF